ncbi:MAG: processive 1,2-diacylglycerol beta-glucosyltransferase [Verrucomicrobiota bacterium]|nr:processive 1,2-diacylglycerol beta-glucosyltransferase [Verrucomicrobiota bacterium]
MKKVLILTAGYGEGHNSAARALQAAFNEYPDVSAELVDLFALRAPRLNEISRRGYLKLINTAPTVWSTLYRWLDRSPRAPAMFRTLASHRRLLAEIIRAKNPTALVSTYPVYGWLLNRLRADGMKFCPHYTVITDAITINSLWYRTPAAAWFVTDHDSAAYLRQQAVPADRVHVSGFPVALAFADRPAHLVPPSPGSAPRILFMINSARGPALRIVRELLKQPGWRLTITAGRDEAFRNELQLLAAGAPAQAEVLGWTDRIPQLLMTHHVVISKAGGATTQESINALCPMLISQIVPGQEEGNYELLRRHEAGALATTPEEIVTTLQRAFADDATLWRRWRANLERLARPSAAREIAARVLSPAACAFAQPAGSRAAVVQSGLS